MCLNKDNLTGYCNKCKFSHIKKVFFYYRSNKIDKFSYKLELHYKNHNDIRTIRYSRNLKRMNKQLQ